MEALKGKLAVGALKLIAALPWRGVQNLGRVFGWLMWKIPNRSREVARINLSHCFPELNAEEIDQLTGRSLKGIGKSFTESACAWIWPPAKTLEYVREVERLRSAARSIGQRQRCRGHHQPPWQLGSTQPLLLRAM